GQRRSSRGTPLMRSPPALVSPSGRPSLSRIDSVIPAHCARASIAVTSGGQMKAAAQVEADVGERATAQAHVVEQVLGGRQVGFARPQTDAHEWIATVRGHEVTADGEPAPDRVSIMLFEDMNRDIQKREKTIALAEVDAE